MLTLLSELVIYIPPSALFSKRKAF